MEKWERRESKLHKRRYGMRVSNRSLKSIIMPIIGKRAKEGVANDRKGQGRKPSK